MSYRKTKFMKVLEPIKKGAYFYFTIPYGIFYICGAIAGYVRDKSNLCLGVSGSIGVVFILLGKKSSCCVAEPSPSSGTSFLSHSASTFEKEALSGECNLSFHGCHKGDSVII